MNYREWNGQYARILKDFGFSREDDEKSAHILSRLIRRKRLATEAQIRAVIEGKDVLVVGGALQRAEQFLRDNYAWRPLIAADGATSVLAKNGILPDIIVTDLDGDVSDQIDANKRGAIIVVHAHGDNIDALQTFVPRLDGMLIGTTQAGPLKNVPNFGGFTDGDRCAFFAAHFGARSITLVGFDFEHPCGKKDMETKREKLKWAKKLIGILEKSGVNIKMVG